MVNKYVPGRSDGTVNPSVDTGRTDPISGKPIHAEARAMIALPLTPCGYVKQTVTAAAGLTTPPAAAAAVLLRVEGADIRWRDDGIDPTTTDGMLFKSTDAPFIYDGPLTAFRAVAVSGSPALHASYYG